MTMEITSKSTIGEIVANDFRTAAVFSKYSIDFCCKGHRTIAEVCKKRDITENILMQQLQIAKESPANQSFDYKSWPVDLLTDYIEKTHHRYVEEKTPVLLQFLNKVCRVHGEIHPELHEINTIFNASASDLAAHMKKEETELFPFIREMKKAKDKGLSFQTPVFGSIENQVLLMKEDHLGEGQRFKKIAALTNDYTPPAGACNTYKVTFSMLQEFESNLYKHIHMENNILFPKAIKLEKNFKRVF
jgi:regulator of cell morphogenesis and NO signaling